MIIVNRPLNYQALALEEAEAEIRETVRREYLNRTPKPRLNTLIIPIIEKALKQIKIERLKKAAKISLVRFYNRQYAEISRISPLTLEVLAVVKLLIYRKIGPDSARVTALRAKGFQFNSLTVDIPKQNIYGVPLKKWSESYIKDNVRPTLDKLCKQQAIDPNDLDGRNSLRNLAEMEVRYNDHLQQIEDLRAAGHKLVIASTHADCSERCASWQGRVYSLDGTSGTTSDGRKFVPLENATNVPYTTKAGITYMNGLLGFNCRHFLVPYEKGFKFPEPNVKEERRQYDITLKQRTYERNVRHWRTVALTSKGIDEERYSIAKQKAFEWNKAYIEFSKKNSRAYYPSRTKII